MKPEACSFSFGTADRAIARRPAIAPAPATASRQAIRGGLRIREALPHDAELVALLLRAAFCDAAADFALNSSDCPTHPSLSTAAWIEREMRRGARFFIGSMDGIVPCCCVSYRTENGCVLKLRRLCVIPKCQRQGAGSDLLRFIEGECARLGLAKIRVSVVEGKAGLHAWYVARGFRDTKLHRPPGAPFRVHYMQKPMTGNSSQKCNFIAPPR